jgi:tetratricopeptide (TPR) repeat protein
VYYEKMLAENFDYPLLYTRLHEFYIKKKEYTKAISVGKRAVKENPGKLDFFLNLGNAYMLNQDTLNGLNYFEKAADLSTDPQLFILVSNVFKATGDTAKALEYQKKAGQLQVFGK